MSRAPFPDVDNLHSVKVTVRGEWPSNEVLSAKEELRDRFGKYGEIGDVYITRNRNLAFVRFVEKEDAEASIDGMAKEEIAGHEIDITMSEQKKKQPNEYPEAIRER